jgi:integrase
VTQTNDGLRKRCGCPRRVWAKCEHPWHLNFTWQGVPHRYSLDKLLKREVRSKTEAVAEAERIRNAIKAGTFQPSTAGTGPACPPDQLLLNAFGAIFLAECPKRKGKHRGEPRGDDDRHRLNRLYRLEGTRGPLGEMPIGTIVEADVEAALRALRAAGKSNSTYNKYLQLCQSLSKWGLKKGYFSRSWFSVDSDVRRENTRSANRHRRLAPDVFDEHGNLRTLSEEQRLLRAAPARLQRLIIAALETCCRAGELIQLQWRHVSGDWLQMPASLTKPGEWREIPISSRLRAVLEMARLDPAGQELPPDAYVFGDDVGAAAAFPHKAWETTVLKAHGHEPRWEPGKGKLTAASRAQLQALDLHFHDLRHEGGSRLLEAGWPLHHVQVMLGHANISQTDTYLNAERHGLRESMRRSDEAARNAQTMHKTPPSATDSSVILTAEMDDNSVIH